MLLAEPLPQWTPTTRHVTETRIALAKSADLLRMEGKFAQAEKLFRKAAKYAEGGAVAHLLRTADQCRTQFDAQRLDAVKAKKAAAAKKTTKTPKTTKKSTKGRK